MSREIRVTPKGRLMFADLEEPTEFDGDGKPKYRMTLVFPKESTDVADLREAIKEAASELSGDWRSPLLDGDETGNYEGCWFVRLTSKYAPALVDQGKNGILPGTGVIYDGCYVRAAYHTYTYSVRGNKGVSLALNSVQKMADGEPIERGSSGTDAFTEVEDAEAEDLLA